jgi:hypothetical protein
MGSPQAFGIEAEFLEAADLEILDQYIRIRGHSTNQRRPFLGRKVDGH